VAQVKIHILLDNSAEAGVSFPVDLG